MNQALIVNPVSRMQDDISVRLPSGKNVKIATVFNPTEPKNRRIELELSGRMSFDFLRMLANIYSD